MLLAGAALWPSVVDFLALWSNSDRPYSHGLLVGPLAIWLAMRACARAAGVPSAPSVGALVLLAVMVVAWLVGFGAHVLAIQQLAYPLILVLAAATLAGWRMALRLAFPIGFVYLAVPVWQYAVPALQGLTVMATRLAVDLADIPVYVEGNLITVPAGVFQIADGCAGLHYFLVALTLSSLYGYLQLERLHHRVAFLASAAAIAIVTNWVRVTSLVIIGESTQMEHYLIKHDHYYYGWVLFAIALVPMLMCGRALANRETSARESAAVKAADRERRRGRPLVTSALVVLLLAASGAVYALRDGGTLAPVDVALPRGQEGWLLVATESDWLPVFVGANGQRTGAYVRGDVRVDVHIAVYLSDAQGRELIGERNLLVGRGLRTLAVQRVEPSGTAPLDAVEERVAAGGDGSRRIVWSWYVVGDRAMTGGLAVKLRQAADNLVGPGSGALVAVSMPCRQECRPEQDELEVFLRSMQNALTVAAAEAQRTPDPVSE